jgi:LysM repeat protein
MVDPKSDPREDFIINKELADDEAEDFRPENYYGNSGDIFRKKSVLPFIIGGVGLIALVLIFGVILTGRDDGANRQALQSLEARIEQLENKLAAGGTQEQLLEQLAGQEQKLRVLNERFKTFEATVSTQIDQIIKELGNFHQKIDHPAVPKAQTLPPAPQKTPAVTPKKGNAPEFYQVQAGDTLFRISRRYGLTVQQLQRYNNLAPDAAIYPGQKLKLRPNGEQ